MPVYKVEIKYLKPIIIGEEIIIRSFFNINKGPRIIVNSKFISMNKKIHAEAILDIVLIYKETFKAVRKIPDFIEMYLNNLSKAS